jgi:hypothetical protein
MGAHLFCPQIGINWDKQGCNEKQNAQSSLNDLRRENRSKITIINKLRFCQLSGSKDVLHPNPPGLGYPCSSLDRTLVDINQCHPPQKKSSQMPHCRYWTGSEGWIRLLRGKYVKHESRNPWQSRKRCNNERPTGCNAPRDYWNY